MADRFQQQAVVQALADNLRIDAATAEVVRRFEQVGVDSVLLKGPALAEWYADDPTRSYLDSDLWVSPDHIGRAAAVIEELGFRCSMDESGLPEWWREHASTWTRESDRVTVDLHRSLQGVGASAQAAWETLSACREPIMVAGHRMRRLSTAGRALYVALHAAHHGRQVGKALVHLERALAVAPEQVWHEALALARRLDALDAFATGLRLLPEGQALAKQLALPAAQSVKVTLRAATPPPVALGWEQLASAQSARERLSIAARKFIPPPGFVRHWWPPAARSRRMLVAGYLYRPLWLLRRAPRGFRAWRKARRQVRRGR